MYRFIIVFLFPLSFSQNIFTKDGCIISNTEINDLMYLNFQEFDQTPNSGWRVYEDRKCYNIAIFLLEEYLKTNQSILREGQIRVLNWHTGQLYADIDNYQKAREKFKNSFDPKGCNDPEKSKKDNLLLWNDYVYCTLAFLDKDMDKLRRHRNNIANGSVFRNKLNLKIVDNFIKCFNSSYIEAYSGCKNMSF